jgi:Amt family ammonium transporter
MKVRSLVSAEDYMNRAWIARLSALLVLAVFLLAPSGAWAAEPVQLSNVSNINSGDTAWMLISTALVLLMTGPGLALFYGGLVRRKNVLSTMMHCFILMALVSVLWAIVGYSLAFDVGSPFIGGLRFALLREVGAAPAEYAPTIPHTVWMAFQMMFAVITPALICGAYAERIKFSSMVVFSSAWLLLVYCPLAHMVWGKGGLLNSSMGGSIPALDFAGGTVVHISSGVSALVCALVLGRRHGFRTRPMPPHSVVLSVIGAAMLWVGWFGFNAGSALTAGSLAGYAFVNTHFAAAAGALGWTLIEWIKTGKPTVLGAISGAVAGLVAITPASGFTLPRWAIVIGAAAGVACFFSATTLKHLGGYDDTLDAFGVHGVGGTLGAILTGIFAVAMVNTPAGFGTTTHLGLIEGSATALMHQFIAVGIAWAMAIVGSLAILFAVKLTLGLRVHEQDEYEGLDLSQHGESGYNIEDAFSATYAGGGAELLNGGSESGAKTALAASAHG